MAVVVYESDGTVRTTVDTSPSTDTQRGTDLINALAAAQDTDIIMPGAGGYDIGTSQLDLSKSASGTVHLVSMTPLGVKVHNASNGGGSGPLVLPGLSGCRIENVHISSENASTTRPALGRMGGTTAWQNLFIRNCRVYGLYDGFFCSVNTNPCSTRAYYTLFESTFDAAVSASLDGNPVDHVFRGYGCRFEAITNPSIQDANGFIAYAGRAYFQGCRFLAQNAEASESTGAKLVTVGTHMQLDNCHLVAENAAATDVYGLWNNSGATGATILMQGGSARATSTGGGAANDVKQSSGIVIVDHADVRAATLAGTITRRRHGPGFDPRFRASRPALVR